MESKLINLKDYIFEQVIMRLKDFNQDFIFEDVFMYNENYYSPRDFVLSFTPEQYNILIDWRKEWLKQKSK